MAGNGNVSAVRYTYGFQPAPVDARSTKWMDAGARSAYGARCGLGRLHAGTDNQLPRSFRVCIRLVTGNPRSLMGPNGASVVFVLGFCTGVRSCGASSAANDEKIITQQSHRPSNTRSLFCAIALRSHKLRAAWAFRLYVPTPTIRIRRFFHPALAESCSVSERRNHVRLNSSLCSNPCLSVGEKEASRREFHRIEENG